MEQTIESIQECELTTSEVFAIKLSCLELRDQNRFVQKLMLPRPDPKFKRKLRFGSGFESMMNDWQCPIHLDTDCGP